jgi:copper chaperone NosL
VAALVVGLVLIAMFAKPSRSWWLAGVGVLFPLGFLSDSLFWLYRFGHSLDAHAPLRIPSFTPQLFGNGTIGQFMTFARPERGFWLAVVSVVLLVAASFLRARSSGSGARS